MTIVTIPCEIFALRGKQKSMTIVTIPCEILALHGQAEVYDYCDDAL